MLRKVSMTLMAVGMVSVLFLSGCGPSANLSLKFSPEDTTTYKATTEVIKDYRFEQPNLNKLREEQTRTLIGMEFAQTIQSVDENGNATAQITVKQLKVDITNKNESQLSFDSQNGKDKNAPMAKLLGQSYTIEITPAGQVKALDTKDALAAVTSVYEKKIAKGILAPKAIADRHGIAALPKDEARKLSVKSSWSEVVPSPKGLLAPKSYEKTYTLTKIKNNIATVQMAAGESAEPVKGDSQTSAGMGMFAKMFDNKDDYTGSMQIDLGTGQVLKSEETLISSYVAQEMPESGDPEKGPDTLTMRFTNRIQLEKLN
ncbi:MAG: DUF6263 family protein [Planctomycetota bacterium]